ncbi:MULTISPECIES: chaplin family protein [Streptomyces]|uniref:Chaplin domain-containing protein n=1 Tax=Streptomyces luteosporeus TaxID=173856 RepID=A0ABP6GGU4_9ACTN
MTFETSHLVRRAVAVAGATVAGLAAAAGVAAASTNVLGVGNPAADNTCVNKTGPATAAVTHNPGVRTAHLTQLPVALPVNRCGN